MISFQNLSSGSIQICCDDAGIDKLVTVLRSLRGSGTHVHLWAPSKGGEDLDDMNPFGEKAVSEVIITHGGDPKPEE